MKAQKCITVAAMLCSLLCTTAAFAQKQSLESVLPAAVQKNLPDMQANNSFLLNKVLAVNPGFKNTKQLTVHVNTALDELKKQKPAFTKIKLPEITPTSYDQLIATKTKQLGAQSGVVKILTAFKEGLAKADDNGDVVDVMVTLIKSPAFQTLSAADKDAFYYAFAAAKNAADYGTKNNLFAVVDYPAEKMGVGGYAATGNGDDDDDEYYMARGAACHWLCTMAGCLAGAYVGAEGGAVAGAAIGFGIGANACY